ncbi:MAG: hypothetical protein GY697_00745 [Desulfobacterales bacterium]|nr:hypothetical protein [Desulfobacterales bacterium]
MGKIEKEVADKGGRRQGIDRRQVDIDEAVESDTRSKQERRSGNDRRDGYDYKEDQSERRESFRIK